MLEVSRVGRALAATAIIASVSSVPRPSSAEQDPQTVTSEVVSGSATIQKIDKANRMVTLKGMEGRTIDFKVGSDVNLDRLRTGEKVDATYYQELAIGIRRHGQSAPTRTEKTTQRGGVKVRETMVTAKVESVDVGNKTVVVRGPDGNTHSLQVEDPDVQAQLSKIKSGDMVDLTYTQAVALSLQPSK